MDNLAQKRDQEEVIAALKAYVKGRVKESVERRILRRRTQHPRESFDDFLVSLRELAKMCNFCSNECLQKAIRDQIIEGLCDGESIQELLQVKDLTLDTAISKCHSLEAAKKSRADIMGAQEINAASVGKTQDPITQLCMGCGGRQRRKCCPAQQRTCHKCGKTGHFGRASDCSTRSCQTFRQGLHPQSMLWSSPGSRDRTSKKGASLKRPASSRSRVIVTSVADVLGSCIDEERSELQNTVNHRVFERKLRSYSLEDKFTGDFGGRLRGTTTNQNVDSPICFPV